MIFKNKYAYLKNTGMSKTPVFFVCKDSNYYNLDCDCYDIKRNALSCTNQLPGVYHPPCRSWGRLRTFASFEPGEHWLALWSLIRVRRYGGVLEHPVGSILFSRYIIRPGKGQDNFNGFSICVNQNWFGARYKKPTMLYIVGITPYELPKYSLSFNAITHSVSAPSKNSSLKEVSKIERYKTTTEFNEFLLSIARLIEQKHS